MIPTVKWRLKEVINIMYLTVPCIPVQLMGNSEYYITAVTAQHPESFPILPMMRVSHWPFFLMLRKSGINLIPFHLYFCLLFKGKLRPGVIGQKMVHLSIRIRSTLATLRLIQSYLSEKQRGAILGEIWSAGQSGKICGNSSLRYPGYWRWRKKLEYSMQYGDKLSLSISSQISIRLALQKFLFLELRKKVN